MISTGDSALLAGLMALSIGLVRVVEALINARMNGKAKAVPKDDCSECRSAVRETHFAVKESVKNEVREIQLLGEIRDGVRDLRRDADRGVTGQSRVTS